MPRSASILRRGKVWVAMGRAASRHGGQVVEPAVGACRAREAGSRHGREQSSRV